MTRGRCRHRPHPGTSGLAFALLLLVFPALFLVILGPAYVLIVENLGTG